MSLSELEGGWRSNPIKAQFWVRRGEQGGFFLKVCVRAELVSDFPLDHPYPQLILG